jgi:hypothetical protein
MSTRDLDPTEKLMRNWRKAVEVLDELHANFLELVHNPDPTAQAALDLVRRKTLMAVRTTMQTQVVTQMQLRKLGAEDEAREVERTFSRGS